MSIHRTAVVSREAEVSEGVSIGAFAVVESDVRIEAGCSIGAQAILKSGSRLGPRVVVHEGAVLAGAPQDLKFKGAKSYLEIGSGCVIRELVTLHRSVEEEKATRIGNDCLLMANAHVAHDCQLSEGVVVGGFTALAGHTSVGPRAFISGGVMIHQFSRIGELAMIGGGSKVNLDAPPFMTIDGVPAGAVGLNRVGLRRAGFSEQTRLDLSKAYRTLYRSSLPLAEALSRIEAMGTPECGRLVEFIRRSERGICRPRRRR